MHGMNRKTLTQTARMVASQAIAIPLFLAGWGIAPIGVSVGVLSAIATPVALAQNAAKTIEGKVLDNGTAPLPGGIVYLQDQKTNVVKTFIATGDGSYRFGQLPASTDYRIWAEYKGEKSKEKLISSFDTKLNVTLNFHIGK